MSVLQSLLALPVAKHAEQVVRPTTSRARRLTRAQTDDLIARYQAGETVYQLGEAFNINRKTVSIILKREGIPTRWRRLSDSDTEQAIQLYRSGHSEAAVAATFSVHPSTIHQLLKRRNVARRPNGTISGSESPN